MGTMIETDTGWITKTEKILLLEAEIAAAQERERALVDSLREANTILSEHYHPKSKAYAIKQKVKAALAAVTPKKTTA